MRSAIAIAFALGLADSVSAAALTGRLNDEIRQSEQLHMELQFARQARADDAELVAKLDLQVSFGFAVYSATASNRDRCVWSTALCDIRSHENP